MATGLTVRGTPALGAVLAGVAPEELGEPPRPCGRDRPSVTAPRAPPWPASRPGCSARHRCLMPPVCSCLIPLPPLPASAPIPLTLRVKPVPEHFSPS